MERIQLLGGSYSARSSIANAQRCINYFAEPNRDDALEKFTLYQRPGLTLLAQGIAAPVRQLYQASNGAGYAVIGANVYSIGANWALTLLGSITGAGANRTNPVSLIDNGTTALLVDGTSVGWTINLASNAFAQLVDSTGTFTGADRVDYIDTFVVGNYPGTRNWWSTLSNSLTFDPTYVAAKTDYPDSLLTLIVNRHELILLGSLKSEIWYDAGNPLFPFAELPGAYIEHGIAAKYSLASADINVYWLARDLQGSGFVMRQRGYDTKRISNHALEYAIRKMIVSTGISDAIGYTYQQDGHLFYVLTFPAGNQTWVYDESIGEPAMAWHQRAWTDPADGSLNRDRSNCCAVINNVNVVGDWKNGAIYKLDLDSYVDQVGGVSGPITCIRGFPHLNIGKPLPQAGFALPVQANGRRMQFSAFYLDMETGTEAGTTDAAPPQIGLRWSTDRGRTFGNTVLMSAGAEGQYQTWPSWRGAIGIARDMIFEISHNLAGPAALNGASVEVSVLET